MLFIAYDIIIAHPAPPHHCFYAHTVSLSVPSFIPTRTDAQSASIKDSNNFIYLYFSNTYADGAECVYDGL